MNDSAERFLAGHPDPVRPPFLEDGADVDGWRVAAFLGRGGSGEVYRVESSGRVAALKLLVRETASARRRFLREADILARTDNPAFPRFFAKGEFGGLPYMVIELLEPRDLPSSDSEVASLLLGVCEGVSVLHGMGYVHRDIKPQNIMFRAAASGKFRPVLIDLGLVKDTSRDEDAKGSPLTLVDGRAAGVGTPGYAAPEQLVGDAVSPAADIHALGVLANACFGGKPSRAWGRIIDRATGSIPSRRYGDVKSFARAVRMRRWRGRAVLICGIVLASAASILPFADRSARPDADADAARLDADEKSAWESLCSDTVTSRVSRIVTGTGVAATNNIGLGRFLVVPQAYEVREVTNETPATVIRLGGRTNVFRRPIRLAAGRDYWIVGPGVLEASMAGPSAASYDAERRKRRRKATQARVVADEAGGREWHVFGLEPGDVVDHGPAQGNVHLVDCVLRNLTGEAWPGNGLYYRLSGDARLETPNLPPGDAARRRDFSETE